MQIRALEFSNALFYTLLPNVPGERKKMEQILICLNSCVFRNVLWKPQVDPSKKATGVFLLEDL